MSSMTPTSLEKLVEETSERAAALWKKVWQAILKEKGEEAEELKKQLQNAEANLATAVRTATAEKDRAIQVLKERVDKLERQNESLKTQWTSSLGMMKSLMESNAALNKENEDLNKLINKPPDSCTGTASTCTEDDGKNARADHLEGGQNSGSSGTDSNDGFVFFSYSPDHTLNMRRSESETPLLPAPDFPHGSASVAIPMNKDTGTADLTDGHTEEESVQQVDEDDCVILDASAAASTIGIDKPVTPKSHSVPLDPSVGSSRRVVGTNPGNSGDNSEYHRQRSREASVSSTPNVGRNVLQRSYSSVGRGPPGWAGPSGGVFQEPQSSVFISARRVMTADQLSSMKTSDHRIRMKRSRSRSAAPSRTSERNHGFRCSRVTPDSDIYYFCRCNRQFTSKENLQAHVKYYAADWSCDECSFGPTTYQEWKDHMMTPPHDFPEGMVSCHDCHEAFPNRSEFMAHSARVHIFRTRK